VLLAGGFDGSSVLNSVDAYDPKTGVMYGPRQMVSPRKNLSATTLIDGRVLLAGGNDGTQDLATMEVADLSSGTISIVGSLTFPRSGHVAITLPNNNDVLITGGSSGGTPIASAELFSPANSSVRSAGNMSVARSGAVAAGSGSLGHVLVAGGESSGNTSTGDLYAFPTVMTDKPEYAPNTVVTITGRGWTPGETVTLVLHEQPTREPDITLTATADASGSFQNTSFKPDVHDEQIDFVLTAEGQVSGVFAQTLFADSVYNTTLSLSSPASGGADSTINPSATLQFGVPVYQTIYYQYACDPYSCDCGWTGCSTCYYSCTGSYQEQVGTNYEALAYQPVQFSFNGGLQVTVTTDSNGIASASLIVPADATSLTVSYAGSTDGTYGPSTAVSNFTVASVPSLLVTATSAYGTYGQPLPPLAYTITGFLNGDTQSLATTGGPSEGTAASPTSTPGLYPIVISQGSLAAANYTFSFVNGALTIQQAASTVSLTSLDSGIYPNQSTTLTATVSVTGSGAAPGGSVNFMLGATSLGTGTLSPIDATDSAATLTLNGSQLAVGANSITAVYSGDLNYGGSTSTAITVTLFNSQTNFGSANVGTAAPVQTLTYNFTGATTLSAVNILTAGASRLDYTDGGGSTCAAGIAYSAGQSCVVTVAFTPSVPGLRPGGVTLFAQGSNLPLMTWYLSGIGQSGAVTIDPGTQSTIATLSNGGQGDGTAIDGSGNVYVVDHVNSQVMELAAGSFTQTTVVTSGLLNPSAVALDGAGNLYVSDTGNNRVEMVPNENGTLNSADMSTVSISGLGSPRGLATDGSGNLYVVDATNGDVVEVPAGGGAPSPVASGLTSPYGVAVDAAGNAYVASSNQVAEYPVGGGTPIPMGSGYNNPSSVAVDASGAVYVADAGNARIVRVAAGGAPQANLAITGITNPQAVAVDGAGNVYVTDSGKVIKINRTQATALVLASTSIGSTSTSQALTVSNAGNQLLTVSNLATTTNFTQVPSGASDCSSTTQLSSSAQCSIAVAFAPTASGTLTGTVTLTDNSLNATSAAQSVALQGTATQASQTITFGSLSNQIFGVAPFTLSATASSGLPVSFASTTPAVCTMSVTTVSLLDVGICTVQATQAGNAIYLAATPVSQSFQVTQEGQTITFGALANQALSTTPFTLSATVSSGLSVSFASTTPAVCTASGTTVTLLAAGTCTIQATQAGNLNDAAATPVNQSFQVVPENQAITFTDAQTTVPTSGLSNPTGLAVDRAGDVFIVDTLNNRVVEVPAGGGAQVTVASGLNGPYGGVAVDTAGDVFVADTRNNRVVEVLAGGGAPITVPAIGLSNPFGVAVDAAGDVFIADSSNGRVVEVPAGGGAQTTLGSGLAAPYGVTVDGAGDLFIADTYNSRVLELPYLGGGTFGPQVTVGSGLYYPTAVAVDAAGNVFIVNGGTSQLVVEVPAGGGPQTTLPLSAPDHYFGVAVDAAGDLFVAGQDNNQVVEVQRIAVNFGSVNVCQFAQTTPAPCSQTITLNYSVNETITVNSTVPVVNQGAPNLDFSLSSATCTGLQAAGSSCTVVASFAPRAPGTRMGAVQLMDPSNNVLVTTMLHGAAQGPAIAFGPGVQTTLPASGLTNPYGVAVDGAGDVFVSDPSNTRVVEIPAGGGPQTTVGSGLGSPFGLAVDGAGDVFISDIVLNQVIEVPAGGGSQTVVASGLSSPYGVAVDAAGDVFIADSGNNRVLEIPAGGGPQTTVGSGLYPYAVAVDGAGDVFVADRPSGNNRVVEIPAGGGPQTTIISGLDNPSGVTVDAAGDVFVADFDNNRIVEVPAGGGPQTTVGSGFYDPFDMAVDGAGNVFIVDWGHSRVVEVQRGQPPTLSFASTPAGSTSADSPQSVTIQNIGTQPLNAFTPGLAVAGPNFLQVAGSGTPADCTSTFSLSPGATCNVSISFEPQTVGSLVSSATFADNALNAPVSSTSSTQILALQGTATQGSQTITFGALSNQVLGSGPFTLSATASSGLAVSFASTTPAVCTVSGTTATLVADGTCTIQAVQLGNANHLATSVSQSFQVTPETQSIAFGALSNQTFGTTPFTVSATASSGLAVTFASTTSPVCTVSGTTVTLLAAGTCTIQAAQAGNLDDAAATPVNQSFQVMPENQAITFGALSNRSLGTASFTLSATASSSLAVSFASTTSAVCTVSSATVTLVAVGTCTIQATQAGNATYAAATPVNQSFQVTQGSQTITFGALSNVALGTAPFTLTATASSSLPVSFASTTPAVCTVSGTTATLVADGTCTIQAVQLGNANYLAISVSQSFQVTPETQSIAFGALSNQTFGTTPFTVSATASSTLAVSFASTTSAVCTVSSATATLVAAGTCTIQATQAGNATYAAATPVNQSFQVSDFKITSTPSSTSVTAGQPGTFTLTLTPQGSFTSAITLSCGGLPAMAGCTFTPSATVTSNASAVTTTLKITTAAHTTALALTPSGHRSSPLYAVCLLLPAMFLGTLGMAKPKGRKLFSYCLVFLLVGSCLFQAACGGASPPGVNTTTGTPAGTYSVVVTAAAGSNQHMTTIMLTVN
jgi:sugar lactone lactonase YvrE